MLGFGITWGKKADRLQKVGGMGNYINVALFYVPCIIFCIYYFTYFSLINVAANILEALHKLSQLILPKSGILGFKFRSIWFWDLDESSIPW